MNYYCTKCNKITSDAECQHAAAFNVPLSQEIHITAQCDIIDPDTGARMLRSGDSINQEVYDWLSFKPGFDTLHYQIAPV